MDMQLPLPCSITCPWRLGRIQNFIIPRCLGLFSTHYQMLTNEFQENPFVKMMYMSFYSDDDRGDMTFLYRLTPGVCSKSYGMVVAKMAGISDEIIEAANVVAADFEKSQQWNQSSNSELSLGKLDVFSSLFKDGRTSACLDYLTK